MASELRNQRKAWSVLIVSTLAFTVCFMVWMMFGVIGIPIKKALDLNSTQFGLLMATPVLTGSLVRVPLGIWTDRYGGRIVMTILMALTVPAIWMMSYATAYWHFLTIGLFVGLAGGSFSVGTPYVARWFPKNRQGMAMGVYGAGNSGAAVNKFVAPVLLVAFGWTMVPQVYAAIMLGTVILFWLFSHSDPSHLVPSNVTFKDQLNKEKLPAAKTMKPMLGQILVKPFESLSMVAKPTSSNPAVITANQAMHKYYQYREESPCKPETTFFVEYLPYV